MKTRAVTLIILLAFLIITFFGLYVPMNMSHGEGCPFALGVSSICALPLLHIKHWQSASRATLVELIVLAAITLILFARSSPFVYDNPQYERYRLRKHIPKRPTLFQELFSQGILHRKEPYFSLLGN